MTLAEDVTRSAKRATRDELAARLEAAERELAEARAERLATGEILEAIGRLAAKPDRVESDLQAVLNSLVGAAVKLCGAANGILYFARGGSFTALAIHAEHEDAEAFAWLKAARGSPDRRTIVGRVLLTGQAQNVASAFADPEYAEPLKSVLASDQAFLGVRLRRGEATVGAIVLARKRVGLFTPRQVEVAQGFADQAVIAIENARLFDEAQARTADLEESLAQQTATADVLKVIGRSAFDLEAVLNTLIGSAQTLCDADFGTICLREGDYFHAYAAAGVDPAFLAALKAKPQHIDGPSLTPRVGRTGRVQHIPDRLLDPEYEAPDGTPSVAHPRTLLGVPLLREGRVEATFVLMRTAHRPFAQKDIELAETFADQAMIAIGNVRLFDEVQARTRDLEESLAQQTATGDVLKVIASSPSDVQPVFDAIAASANRLLGGLSGAVLRMIGGSFHLAAFTPVSPAADQALKQAFPRPITEFPALEGLRRGETVEFPDTEAEDVPAVNRDLARARGYRAMLHVPLLSGGAPIGLISVTRAAPGPFAVNHIELLRAFADQAVIAIRNVDLFNETKEALERQTATADILKVIASSPSDIQPVFSAIAASANRLLGGHTGAVLRFIGDEVHLAAFTPTSPEADADLKARFPRLLADFPFFDTLRAGEVAEFADTEAAGVPQLVRDPGRLRGYRAMLHLPLISDARSIGSVSVTRAASGPFSSHHVELMRTFADQAVIAIRNVDLFNETKEALKQQTATADVLKVISRSAFDLQKVLDTLVHSARELCAAESVALLLYEGKALRFAAGAGMPQKMAEFDRDKPADAPPDPLSQYVVESRRLVHVADFREDPRFSDAPPIVAGGFRAGVGVPMLRDGEVLGFFGLMRFEPKAFSEREIALAQTFVDQAQIAIENARLFEQVRAKTRDLEESLAQQTATADVLKTISRAAFDLQAVFEALLKSAVDLSGAHGGALAIRDGEIFKYRAFHNNPPDLQQFLLDHPAAPGAGTLMGRVALAGHFVIIEDVTADANFAVKLTNDHHAVVGVPLLRQGRVDGAILLSRREPGPFSARAIELIQTFADQAVIAIENARLLDEVRARTRDLEESLAQQTATADVLKVISRSVFDLDTVLQSLIDTAVRLTRGSRGTIFIKQGEALVARAFHSNVPGELRKYLSSTEWRLDGDSHMARAVRDHTIVHVPDLSRSEVESDKEVKKRASFGAGLWIPLMRGEAAIGVFGVPRDEPIAFSDREIELVQTFADQAVIAIENSRLFEQVRAKTRDLEDALAKQTATAEILRVISRSPTDANPVFESIVVAAARLLPCDLAFIMLVEGKSWWNAAAATSAGMSKLTLLDKYPVDPSLNFPSRAIVAKTTIDLPDWSEIELPEHQVRVRALNGINASIHVPFLREGECVGLLTLLSRRPRAFGPSEIAQAESFRDQALIAIENSRLFEEVQARTRDLEESLAQQTATADVLKVISRSAFDLRGVFEALIAAAANLLSATHGSILLEDGDVYRVRATVGLSEQSVRWLVEHPLVPDRSRPPGRAILNRRVEVIPDVLADEALSSLADNPTRAVLAAPLLGKDRALGALVIAREEPGAFTQRQIELVETFANQAVIAIENARLFDEVQARTRELEQSLSDLRKAQDRLVQSEKLASLGQLTAGIAHEIKNPLNFVNNFASLSRELLDEMKVTLAPAALDSDARADVDEAMTMLDANLEKIAHHGRRADSIVKNMLLHSREGSGERRQVNVNAMVEEALNLGYHGARAEKPGLNVTIEKSLDPLAGEADLYLQEITRVILNLISNGFYATAMRKETEGAGYQPTLTASTRSLGQNVEIRVRDNGVGVPEDVRAKMFNPFFTTKPAGEGTGLGLSLSHDIVVKQHGGAIDVETEPGSFTEFIITLPREGAAA